MNPNNIIPLDAKLFSVWLAHIIYTDFKYAIFSSAYSQLNLNFAFLENIITIEQEFLFFTIIIPINVSSQKNCPK